MLPPPPGVLFTKHPTNQTVSQGNTVRLGCAVQGLMEPDIVWLKDGEKLYSTDQMFITLGEQHWETFHSVKSVQQQDAGQYWCEVEFHDLTFSSQRAWITVEGVPHFIQEPQDVATFPNVPFNLTCAAVGPPEPVEVLWWLGGVQEGDPRLSPSVLQIQGNTHTHTRKVLAVKPGLKCPPSDRIAPPPPQVSRQSTQKLDLPHQEVLVPPHIQVLSGLRSYSNYSVRVACVNEVGASPFSPWLQFQTPESGELVGLTEACSRHVSLNNTCRQLRLCPANMFNVTDRFDSVCASPVDCLGISDDLKDKLQDVLIPERLITLGHMLGKGEFGSVREAYLKMEDSSVHKVAVKVLKSDVTSSGDIEQCLKEAAYMKDFHHPNVIQLIGVSLHRRPGQRLPIPMVVLPFMKHGDLHTFLLLSRLGEQPFDLSLQTLVQFMLDISRGMEYLSSRNIIHRDLAARNCMLNEDMSVCVADFGLSKKIYSGDYYRQGSVSKLPVKWIALESLADNVYTTQSDVWAFGVTMWEVMTRGQTPYPGVENSEIYEYLIKGERLKKPLDCRDDVYELMHSCWSPVPKCRPSFQHLVSQLEALWVSVSPTPLLKEPLLYVNLDGEEREVCRDGVGAAMAPGPEEQTDWLMVGSGAALAIGGDYRYIIGPCGGLEEEGEEGEEVGGGAGRRHTLQEEMRDEDDDVIINV
uniref:Tyrosine-protein kinase receptor TYRO3 n=1 Tax=Anabas testudineus TaxID=64144 RepID=A0A7N6FBI6_ANATE